MVCPSYPIVYRYAQDPLFVTNLPYKVFGPLDLWHNRRVAWELLEGVRLETLVTVRCVGDNTAEGDQSLRPLFVFINASLRSNKIQALLIDPIHCLWCCTCKMSWKPRCYPRDHSLYSALCNTSRGRTRWSLSQRLFDWIGHLKLNSSSIRVGATNNQNEPQ